MELMIGLGLTIVGALLSSAFTKRPEEEEPKEWEEPTVDSVNAIPYFAGSEIFSSPNILWFGDKSLRRRKVPMEGAKT